MRRLFPESVFVAPAMVPGNRLAIAEAPGEVEEILGEPLVGPTGSWLRGKEVDGRRTGGLYKAAGVNEAEVSRCNIIQCRPPNNIFPTDSDARVYIPAEEADAAVKQCFNNHVVPILRGRDWKRIDILGGKALQYAAEIPPAKGNGIMRWRGSPLRIPATGRSEPLAVATIHPAALARDQSLIPAVVSDLRKSLIIPPEYYDTHPNLDTVRTFRATEFAADIETNRFTGEILLVGLCAKAFEAIVIPAKGQYLEELRRIFKNATAIVGQNWLQFDGPMLERIGIESTATIWDTMLMQHLLQPDMPHDLGFIGSIYTNKPAWKHLSGDDEALYCARDCDVTWQAYRQLKPQLRAEKLLDLYEKVQVPLARLCYMMHEHGIRMSSARLTEVRTELAGERRELENLLPDELRTQQVAVRKREIAPPGTVSAKTGKPLKYQMVDASETVVPWQSQQILAQWLYETKKLPVQFHVKTGQPSTDKTVLPKLLRKTTDAEVSKSIRAIQKLRSIQTLESGFAKESFLGISRVHPHFNVHGTASGRLSSSDPNLQNQPPVVRYIYVPDHEDWRFIEVDYSGIENRLTAWFAQDHERLAKLDEPGFNEHKWTASMFFDIPIEDVVKDNDRDAPYGKAKRINHGCFTPGHEVLTPGGWIKIENYTQGTPIAEWETSGKLVFRVPKRFIKEAHNGAINNVIGTSISFQATPDHTFPFASYWKQKVYFKKRPLAFQGRIPVCGELDTAGLNVEDRTIRQIVAVQADASWVKGKYAYFHLVKERKQKRLEELFGIQGNPCGCHPGGKRYYVKFQTNLLNQKKQFSWALLAFSAKQRRIFLDELLQWDGSISKGEGTQAVYYNTDRESAELVQTIAHLNGQQALLRKRRHGSFGNKPVYSVSFNRRKLARLENLNREGINYSGPVYCFETQSGYFLFKHRNKIAVSGNSNYGMGARKIAAMYDMHYGEVQNLVAKWRQINAKTVTWQTETAARASKDGFLITPFGRKRWFYTDSRYTESLSFLPQSTAADIIFRTMLGLFYDRIGLAQEKVFEVTPIAIALPRPARLHLQIHDSLLISAPGILVPECLEVLRTVMEQPWQELGGYKIPIECKVGEDWGSVKPV